MEDRGAFQQSVRNEILGRVVGGGAVVALNALGAINAR
jgi:hypothetical protein